ncbi:helix-turn-helix protein [Comamonas sp. BIGb0124]|nr:helix-turn-helix protein [Comamonas sp. BIGb0124]
MGILANICAMSKSSLPAFPTVLKQLALFGERVRLARARRGLRTELFAERVGVSRETLRRMEKGDPTIAIGTYLRALRVLGLDKDIDLLAADDELGRKLQDLAITKPRLRTAASAFRN